MYPSEEVIKKIQEIVQTLDYSTLKVHECCIHTFKVVFDFKSERIVISVLANCFVSPIAKIKEKMATNLFTINANNYHFLVVCVANNRKGNLVKANDDDFVILANKPNDAVIFPSLLRNSKTQNFAKSYLGSRMTDNEPR